MKRCTCWIVTECTLALHPQCLETLILASILCNYAGRYAKTSWRLCDRLCIHIACNQKDFESRSREERQHIDKLRTSCNNGSCPLTVRSPQELKGKIEMLLKKLSDYLDKLYATDPPREVSGRLYTLMYRNYLHLISDILNSLPELVRLDTCDTFMRDNCMFRWYRCREHDINRYIERFKRCVPKRLKPHDKQGQRLISAMEDMEKWVIHGVIDANGCNSNTAVYTHDSGVVILLKTCGESVCSVEAIHADETSDCGLISLLNYCILGRAEV